MDGPFQNIADETTEQGDPQRHATRESIFLAAQLRIPPERVAVSARVRNISPGGMMVDFAAAATVGEPLIVEIKGVGPVAGKVAFGSPKMPTWAG